MFLLVFKQVLILLILIILGVLLTRFGIFTEAGVKSMTDLVIYIVTPCVIVKSFIRKFDPTTLKAILISFIAAVGVHLLFIILANLLCHSKDEARRRILRFGVIFTNCGYMALPLQQELLGDNGVLYGASFIAIFNIIVWSYGIAQISGDKRYISPKKLIFNPGILSVIAGLIIFLASLPVHPVIATPIESLAALNTPVPMMIIGYHLAKSDIKKAFCDWECLLAIGVRLVVLPLVAIGLLYICGLRGDLFVSIVIAACAPTGALTTMFAAKFNKATDLSVNMVSLSTVLSLITIPLLVSFAQSIA